MSTPNPGEWYGFDCNRSYSVGRNFVYDFPPFDTEHSLNGHKITIRTNLLPVALWNHFVHICFVPNIWCDELPKRPYAVNGPQNRRINVPANCKTYCNPLAFTWKIAVIPIGRRGAVHHSQTQAQLRNVQNNGHRIELFDRNWIK